MSTAINIPGATRPIEFERDPQGRLTRVTCEGRCYLDATVADQIVFDGGFVIVKNVSLPNALLRSVTTASDSWTETYRWDTEKLMTEVDGVEISYDSERRVASCRGPEGSWFYGYSGNQLTVIDTPQGMRQILRDKEGRPIEVRGYGARSIRYDAEGRRLPKTSPPSNWNLDASGRLWTVTAPDGRVIRTYLWSDFQCFARIDGPPGDPLAGVFSLDLTGTPVRIIERGGMRRIPRDAFGEALLGEAGVPKLYSGFLDGDLVRLPYRLLDPRTGSFDSRDPFTGLHTDPRRKEGYEGPLAAEFPKAGPYTVSRHNPLTLADPTGAISDTWWLIPSSLTWSYQNTMLSLFGFWLTADVFWGMPIWFLANLFTAFQIDDLRNSPLGGGFSLEGLPAKNFHAFALRASGLVDALGPQTFTYQFIVSEGSAEFDQLAFARLFVPDAAYSPALNGTVLYCTPTTGTPFVLAGQQTPPNGATMTTWARCGGTGVAAIPGSEVPIFPEGGMHFSQVQADRPTPQSASMIELEPTAPLIGSITNRAVGIWTGGASGAATGQTVALIGTAIEIVNILSVTPNSTGGTVAQFDTPAATVAGTTVRMRGVAAPLGPENLTQAASQVLNAVGSALDYQLEDILRLTQGTSVVAVKVDRFEAQLTVDDALPSAFGAGFELFTATATGNFNGTLNTPTELQINTGTVPGVGAGVAVGTVAAIVLSVDTNKVTVDRALGAAGSSVTWRNLTRNAALGDGVAGAPSGKVRYTPDALRAAPTTGFVWVEQGVQVVARAVTARDYDGLAVSSGVAAGAHSVELFKTQAPDISGVAVSPAAGLQVGAALVPNIRAFHLMQLTGSGIAAGTALLTGATLSGQALTGTVTSGSVQTIIPASAVVLGSGTTVEAGVVKTVRAEIRFSKDVPGRNDNLEAVLLTQGSAYAAELLGPLEVRVIPQIGAVRVDMPRFRVGELVMVNVGLDERLFRVVTVTPNGSTITCDGDDPIPAGTPTVSRLTVANPNTGTSRRGINGKRISTDTLEFTVWNTTHFADRELIAVVGDEVVVRRVTFSAGANRTIHLDMAGAVGVAAPVTISGLNVAAVVGGNPLSAFSSAFTITNNVVNFLLDPAVTAVATAGVGNLLAVPYVEHGTAAAGTLQGGNVRVPDDHENESIENNRVEAVIDHELTHTVQSARLGPWFFTWWPNWLGELLGDLPGSFGGPTYSVTLAGTIEGDKLIVPTFNEVGLQAKDTVQVSQDGKVANIILGTFKDADKSFKISRANRDALVISGISVGAVGVRRHESAEWKSFFQAFQGVTQFLTPGGLMNFVSAFSYGGFIWLIMRIIQGVKAHRETSYDGTADNTAVVTLKEGVNSEGLVANARVIVQQGDKTLIRTVQGVADRAVTLANPVRLEGDVRMGLYTPGSPFFGDMNTYLPATIPDPNRPARLQVAGLSTQLDDEIIIRDSNGRTISTEVTAVISEDTFEVEEPVLSMGELFVARQSSDDPIGQADRVLLNKMQLGFLQYIHDPWGQIHYRTRPSHPALQVLTRGARYLFGTESWGLPALTGYLFWDNLYRQGNPATSAMEQEASHWSGDTYCPLATLHGDVSFVGDVGRYWLTATGALRNFSAEMINTNLFDAPGVHWLPFHTPGLTTPASPTSATPPAATPPPGTSLPDIFASKNAAGTSWTGIAPTGWIPSNPRLQRSHGSYVAFTQPSAPGSQFAADVADTDVNPVDGVMDTPTQINNARFAAFNGPSRVITSFVVPVPPTDYRVTIEHKRTVQDVTVQVAGLTVAEGGRVNLIPYQTAAVVVSPNGARAYRPAVTLPGRAVTISSDGQSITAAAAAATDLAEISRFYQAVDATTVTGIGKMHLAADVDIAIRRFQIDVATVLIIRATADVTAAAVPDARAGDTVFLLVPAPRVATPAPLVTGDVPVNPTVDTQDALANAATRTYIGSNGAAYSIAFNAQEPPEKDETVTFTWSVGNSVADSATVTATLTLKPHFTLDSATGFNVAAGGSVTLTSSNGAPIQLQGTVSGVTAGPGASPSEVVLTIDPAAVPGTRDILVRDIVAGTFARRRITITP